LSLKQVLFSIQHLDYKLLSNNETFINSDIYIYIYIYQESYKLVENYAKVNEIAN